MFVRNRQQLVVDCYPPRKVRVLWTILLLLVAALLWSLLVYAPGQLEASSAKQEARRLELVTKLTRSEAERARLQSEVERYARMEGVNGRAYETLQKDFDLLQREMLRLREELAFYRTVTGPGGANAEVEVQRFLIKPDGTAGGFLYTLVLVHSKEGRSPVKGKVRIRLRGTLGGESKVLLLTALSEPPVDEIPVRFRYFQDLSGSFRLPQGFKPERLEVEIDLDRPHRDIKQSYSWSQLQS